MLMCGEEHTKMALRMCTACCPRDTVHAQECMHVFDCVQVNYTTIAGKFIKGASLTGEGEPLAKFAGAGYQQVRVIQWATIQ